MLSLLVAEVVLSSSPCGVLITYEMSLTAKMTSASVVSKSLKEDRQQETISKVN